MLREREKQDKNDKTSSGGKFLKILHRGKAVAAGCAVVSVLIQLAQSSLVFVIWIMQLATTLEQHSRRHQIRVSAVGTIPVGFFLFEFTHSHWDRRQAEEAEQDSTRNPPRAQHKGIVTGEFNWWGCLRFLSAALLIISDSYNTFASGIAPPFGH